ncbi:MAG: GNAT family N-acetyltransferase [SAR202 cluster bacterium]|nr:GNAT family N-acetyltransferase [SAR202 cluster bacterium]
MDTLNIRTFHSADHQAVRQLFARSLMDFAGDLQEAVSAYVQHSLSDDMADIPRHYLSNPGGHFWVAELAGAVAGTVGIQRRSETEAELRRMSVATGQRRQGIGGQLLDTAEQFCREQGYRQIRLTTVTLLVPAIAMYRKHGYQQVGQEKYGQVCGLHFVKGLA